VIGLVARAECAPGVPLASPIDGGDRHRPGAEIGYNESWSGGGPFALLGRPREGGSRVWLAESMIKAPGVLCVVLVVAASVGGAAGHAGEVALDAGAGRACPRVVQPGDLPATSASRYDQDVIVYTANQGWLSRIYVLGMDGAVINFFEYDFYIFSDVEVVDNEVYVTEWIAPRVYKVDIETGNLEVVIDDWSLTYLYDLAWDGDYFYAKEWSLNRYELDGTWAGSASLPETVRGSAWDGTCYWTLNSDGEIRCWDLSAWPAVTEIPENAFAPASSACRGLWFDGEYFWTAESIEDNLGQIYQFDKAGAIIDQWREPAFRGYAACVIAARVPADLNGDGCVDQADLGILLADWGCSSGDCPGDCDNDDDTDQADLGILLAHWGDGC
jgi:hypothetical protein